MPQRPDWQPAFVLPNLALDLEPDVSEDVALGLTIGLDGIAIVPATDPRVMAIRKWSSAADRFLSSFVDGYGTTISPALLIVRNDYNSELQKDVTAVISFRNAVAICSILAVRAHWPDAPWRGPAWSEAFDYHSVELTVDGSHLNLFSPAQTSYHVRPEGLRLSADVRVPRTSLRLIDDYLARRLGRLWNHLYRQKIDKRKIRKVFRSLEAAYQALRMPARHYSSLTEVGLTSVSWATAIEVLASPQDRNVNVWDCIELIDGASESVGSALKQKRYWALRGGGKKRHRQHMTLAARIFLYLHHARSKFVHGDKISKKLLLPFGEEVPILSLASSVYRVALGSYLDRNWPYPPSWDDPLSWNVFPPPYDDHLLKAGEPRMCR